MACSISNSSPGPSDSLALKTTTGKDKDTAQNGNFKVLHAFHLPHESHYGSVFEAFKGFGKISEIRMEFIDVEKNGMRGFLLRNQKMLSQRHVILLVLKFMGLL